MKPVVFLISYVSVVQFFKLPLVVGDDDEPFDACRYRKHITFKPTATCCANQTVTPGINIDAHWQACKSNGGATLEETAWNIYSCVLKKSGGKSPITLAEFANLMTDKYPEEIKSKIVEEVNSVSELSAPLSDHDQLQKIRSTYYDIEMEVCDAMLSESEPSKAKQATYGKIEACSSWKEENHRRGFCCKKAYPIDMKHNSLMDLSYIPDIKEKCNKLMGPKLKKELNATDIIISNLMEICDVACAIKISSSGFDLNDKILNNREYWNFKIEEALNINLLPEYYPNIIDNAKQYVRSTFNINTTIDAMKNYEFADVILGNENTNTDRPVHHTAFYLAGNNKTDNFETDFLRRPFPTGVMHVAVICSAYKEILTYMEYFLFKDCAPEVVTEPSAPEPEPTTEEPAPEPEPTTEEPAPEPEPTTEAAS